MPDQGLAGWVRRGGCTASQCTAWTRALCRLQVTLKLYAASLFRSLSIRHLTWLADMDRQGELIKTRIVPIDHKLKHHFDSQSHPNPLARL